MNRSSRRFLFLFSDTGGGHRSSATAVADALKEQHGERGHIEMVDALADYAPWPFNRLGDLYPYLVRMKGVLWAAGYHLSDGPTQIELITRGCWPIASHMFPRIVYDYPADAIVCFHPIFNHLLLRALEEKTRARKPPVITMVTDLHTAHAFWIAPEVNYCLVPTSGTRKRALDCGMPAERVFVTGLPVSPIFARTARESKTSIRRRLGLDEHLPTVLLVSGAEGMGALYHLSRLTANSGINAQMVVIAGRNERMEAKLANRDWPLPVRVEGYVDNMHEWMGAADLLVSKAGPSTVSEALVMGLPIVLSDALPGQERPNVDYVVRGGAGLWAPTPKRVAGAIRDLMAPGNPRLAQMAARSRALARPDAARQVAEFVWNVAGGEGSGLAEFPFRPESARSPGPGAQPTFQ